MEATEYEFRIFAENVTGFSRPRRTPMGIKTKLSGEFELPPLQHCVLTARINVTFTQVQVLLLMLLTTKIIFKSEKKHHFYSCSW